jgi:multiple sugar transport system permease protein
MRPITNRFARFLIYLALTIFVAGTSIPFLWTVLQSLKTVRQANSRVPLFIFKPTLDSYAKLWFISVPEHLGVLLLGILAGSLIIIFLAMFLNRRGVSKLIIGGGVVTGFTLILWAIPHFMEMADWYDFFVNTLIVTAFSVTISIALSATAGYAIARKQGMSGALILVVALALGSLPPMVFALPYYQISAMLGIQDSYILVIAVMVGLQQPFAVWLLRGFFMEIPRDIDDSAMIDGASRLRAFWSVVAPIAWPGVVAVALLNVLGVYHSFLIIRVLTTLRWTLAVAITKYVGTVYAATDTIPFAAAVSASIPLLILVFVFQEQLVKGLGSGAVKG